MTIAMVMMSAPGHGTPFVHLLEQENMMMVRTARSLPSLCTSFLSHPQKK